MKQRKHKKNERIWLTREERRVLARKNIAFLNRNLSKTDWVQIFNETVNFSDTSYNSVISEDSHG